MDKYIAEALKSTGTRKSPRQDAKPAAVIRHPTPAPAPAQAARPAPRPTPAPIERPRTPSTPPHSVVARTSSHPRTPTPPNAAPIAVARTRSASASPLAIARARELGLAPADVPAALPRSRAPQASSSHLPQADDLELATDFDEDTVPEMTAACVLTDQDDVGVRRS